MKTTLRREHCRTPLGDAALRDDRGRRAVAALGFDSQWAPLSCGVSRAASAIPRSPLRARPAPSAMRSPPISTGDARRSRCARASTPVERPSSGACGPLFARSRPAPRVPTATSRAPSALPPRCAPSAPRTAPTPSRSSSLATASSAADGALTGYGGGDRAQGVAPRARDGLPPACGSHADIRAPRLVPAVAEPADAHAVAAVRGRRAVGVGPAALRAEGAPHRVVEADPRRALRVVPAGRAEREIARVQRRVGGRGSRRAAAVVVVAGAVAAAGAAVRDAGVVDQEGAERRRARRTTRRRCRSRRRRRRRSRPRRRCVVSAVLARVGRRSCRPRRCCTRHTREARGFAKRMARLLEQAPCARVELQRRHLSRENRVLGAPPWIACLPGARTPRLRHALQHPRLVSRRQLGAAVVALASCRSPTSAPRTPGRRARSSTASTARPSAAPSAHRLARRVAAARPRSAPTT